MDLAAVLAATQPNTTISVHGALTITLLVGAVCTALLAIVAVARPLVKLVSTLDNYAPVLLDIARNFRSPDGNENLTVQLTALVNNQTAMLGTQREAIEAQRETAEKVDRLHEYSHDLNHNVIIPALSRLTGTEGTAVTLVQRMSDLWEEIKVVKEEVEAMRREHPPTSTPGPTAPTG